MREACPKDSSCTILAFPIQAEQPNPDAPPAAGVARSARPTHPLLHTRFLACTPDRHAAERERVFRYWMDAMGCPVPPKEAS